METAFVGMATTTTNINFANIGEYIVKGGTEDDIGEYIVKGGTEDDIFLQTNLLYVQVQLKVL